MGLIGLSPKIIMLPMTLMTLAKLPCAAEQAVPPVVCVVPEDNPRFRVFTFNNTQNETSLVDFDTYYANITYFNNNNLTLEYSLLYRFRETYEMSDMSRESFIDLIKRLQTNQSLYKKFANLKYANNDTMVESDFIC